MDSFFDPERNVGVTLDPGGAINRKMVFVKFVQDQKMNPFRYGTGNTKKNDSPYQAYKSRHSDENSNIIYNLFQSWPCQN